MFAVLSRYLRIKWSSMRSNWMLWLIATRPKHSSASDQPLKRCLRRIDIWTRAKWIWWVLKRRKKDSGGGGKGAFAWILGVLHYSILKCHKNCHKIENTLKRTLWIEQIKSVLVETPATSTTFPFFNVHLTRLNISKHFLFLALFTFINLNPWFSDMAFYVFNGSYKFVFQPILGARVDLSDW